MLDFIIQIFTFHLQDVEYSWLPAVIGAVGGIANSILGNSMNKSTSKSLMDYQTMKQQQLQSWMFSHQYPQEIAAMKAAGLNPAFMQGSTLGTANAQSPNARYEGSKDIFNSQAISQLAQLSLLGVEKEKMEAEKEKTLAEKENISEQTTNLQNINDTFYPQFYANLEKVFNESSYFRSSSQVNEKRLEQIGVEIDNLKKQTDKLDSEIKLNMKSIDWTDKQIQWYDNYMMATIREKVAQASFLSAQEKETLGLLLFRQNNYSALTRMYNTSSNLNVSQETLNRSTKEIQDINKEFEQFNLKLAKRYGDVKEVVGIASDVVGTAAHFMSAGGMLMMGMNGAKNTFGHTSETFTPSLMGDGSWTKTSVWSNMKKK